MMPLIINRRIPLMNSENEDVSEGAPLAGGSEELDSAGGRWAWPPPGSFRTKQAAGQKGTQRPPTDGDESMSLRGGSQPPPVRDH